MGNKVLILAGTRPEAIKVAPVVLALREDSRYECVLCSSGQHREMLRQAFADFGLVPDRDLDVMVTGQTLASLSSRLFAEVDRLLVDEAPDWVLVQGDTTTVMCVALCGFYRGIKVAHLEAGLRSFDLQAPFPEELNRRVASIVADLHFAPTDTARENLLAEKIAADRILVTGNTVIDALLYIRDQVRAERGILDPRVQKALAEGKRLVLITGHRRENFGDGFLSICRAIRRLADSHPDTLFVYPVHLNPNVRQPVLELLSDRAGVLLLEPLPYKAFIALMDASTVILTDSGGVQEEAPSLGKPVLVMRDVTERPEGVAAGAAKLVGTDEEVIVAEVSRLLDDPEAYARMTNTINPYGDGRAAQRIIAALLNQ
ncbi:MAG TPA: UDP-N-acetylglucosamine 2-epimerase (non-hydrolyzing) [Humidesulfovibrio sp.]|uniref:non-hydrolyzing UDP-N-acetylglucosamine 2-epimerase n=1 Tax=Humidesulfovibrio sp. TaxID=2910988 RepID=UPI002BC74CA9|nr:UDP-N-acetylglucosamine 2-epimerase (non-hydrolyzing) [Humidesulfovibrio sp.]HWR02656.1 UDP-N-acetylglucosamine 2-epimerase (non-hydrolyzing) [Humidesulfovibrio sp.]